MSDHMDKHETSNVRSLDSRPTIGILAEVGGSPYHAAIWDGFIDAASELDVNLIWYLGDVARLFQNSMQDSVFHDLIAAERVDGLLMSGTLGNYVATTEFESFIDRYRPMPMVGIAQAPGIPCVTVDNKRGVRDTVAHLHEVHGYRRIAFIRGPEKNEEAQVRYGAYVDALEEQGLTLDPGLVAPGTFVEETGTDAVRLLLDERKVKFEAIVAANDWMAFGALKALEDRGIRVPEDIALTGFDDTVEAMVSSPPLTTVQQPIKQLGYACTRVMLRLLAGEQIPEQTMLPTRIIVRQSCGCVEPTVAHIPGGPLRGKKEPLKKIVAARREEILSEMAQVTEAFLSSPNWAEQLLTALSDEIVSESTAGRSDVELDLQGPFLSTLHNLLQQTSTAGGQAGDLQKIISVMRHHIRPHVTDFATLTHTEALFDRARVAIDRTSQRNWMLQEVEKTQLNNVLDFLRSDLATRIDTGHLTSVLNHRLPQLGFTDFYLSLYEGQDHFTPWSRLVLAHKGRKRVNVDATGQRFLTHRLTPDELIPQKRRYTWIVSPLFFEDNQFGCLVLEVGSRDAAVYASLTRLISGAMHDSLLIRQLEVRRVQMLTAAEVSRAASSVLNLDELVQQVVSLVQERFGLLYTGLFLIEEEWAVLRAGTGEAGQQMLAEGYRLKIGGGSTIGRCVIDRQACIAPGVEQRNEFEETRAEMALPLISRGEVIGALTVQSTQETAFGSEDIVVFQTMADQLANAIANAWLYERAQRAYAEVEQQVAERTAELQQEIAERKRAEKELRRYRDRLEELVVERTRELEKAQIELVRQERLSALGQLIATVAHEIRNPLGTVRTSVFSISDAIKRDKMNRVERALQLAERNIVRCDAIIAELLDYTRDQVLQKSPVRIDTWLDRLLDEALDQRTIPESITLVRELHADAEVLIDGERLRRAVINVVENAVDAVREKGPLEDRNRLTVSTQVTDGKLEIRISDTGCGIPDEVMDRLFEPLFSTKSFGVGLGLSIVKSITEQHDGGIEVSSQVGEGTTIILWLPTSEDRGG
jgi:DNA-binding LacI/PurR family transcriptional regulator/signal transduction histidine kinase